VQWYVVPGEDIITNEDHLQARRKFIRRTTNANVSEWKLLKVSGLRPIKVYHCISYDGVNGSFITAHIDDIRVLCYFPAVYKCKLVVTNTCILTELDHKRLLHSMMYHNCGVELYYTKQELWLNRNIMMQTALLEEIGQFGFQTSLSERNMYLARGKGLMSAICASFERVSPILLLIRGI
jgi:hypothetical protein